MKKIRALVLEDNPDEAELMLYGLAEDGYDVTWKRVDRPESFRTALEQEQWDVILADFKMPHFSAPAALDILRASGKDIPFIIVSGSIGEAIAVEAMKAGAHDYFVKTNLTRLGAAVEREIREAQVRHEGKQAVAELRRAEERHRLLVENVRDYAIFMLDAAGNVTSWNQGAERVTGYKEAEILGKPLAIFFREEEQPACRSEEALNAAAERGSHLDEGPRIRRDGTQFWAMSTLDRILMDGNVIGYTAIFRDITEKKRLLDDLRQAVHARDEFLSIASHELKTPLTSMGLQLESLRKLRHRNPEVQLSDDKVAKKLDTIERQSQRLTVLINNLLNVTRITSGRLELRPENVDLRALVDDVMGRMREWIDRSGCQISFHAQDGVVGTWDRLHLETAVENLLSNATKFGAGKPIDVTIDRDASHARLHVHDRGIGISSEQLARVFQRFERAVPEQHYGGLGLGLWTVRQIVEAHRGAVRVDSKTGEGSTFTLEIPFHMEAPP
jgi:PAS domain S-box-containing protein